MNRTFADKRLVGALAAGQLLAAASSPILTHRYEPAAIAEWTVLAAVASIVGAGAAGRLDQAVLVAPEPLGKSVIVAGLCLSALVGIGTATVLAFLIMGSVFHWAVVGVVFVGVGASLSGIFQIATGTAVREQRYGDLARARFFQPASFFLAVAAGAVTKAGLGALLVADLCNRGVGASALLRRRHSLRAPASWTLVRSAISRYRLYLFQAAPAASLSVAAQVVMVALAPVVASPSEVAQLGIAVRILVLPVTVLAQAVGSVATSDIARYWRDGNRDTAKAVFVLRTKQLSIIAVALFTLGAAALPKLAAGVLGSQWAEVGQYAALLAPSVSLAFVMGAMSPVYGITGVMRRGLAITIMDVTLRVGAVLLIGQAFGLRAAIATIGVGAAVLGCVNFALLADTLGFPTGWSLRAGVLLALGAGATVIAGAIT